MGRLFLEYLSGRQIYVCLNCNTHLVDKNDLFSKVMKVLKSVEFPWENRESLSIQQSVNWFCQAIEQMYLWGLKKKK